MPNNKQARTNFAKPAVKPAVVMTDSKSPQSSDTALLQMRIPKNVKREFRQMALDEDITMTELFLRMFEDYRN